MDFDFDKESKKPLVMKIFIEVFIWAAQIAAVIFLAYFIVYYALERTEVVGISMENTLFDGEQIIINKFSYRFTDPKRFDVIVFKQSGEEHSYYDIKRIIALPEETVHFQDGEIYIDGEPVKEVVNVEPMGNYGLAAEEIKLEENEYFVLGDNRNNSEDSRFASVGMIRREEIVGKAFIRISPFNFVNKLNLLKETEKEKE
ncbi:signal peptidase I [Anaerotaenia torta]|uniref:signal peptidase I n=1 Tax=Anaerotaenia torta TaxID=433293 RepID=UPI003D257C76